MLKHKRFHTLALIFSLAITGKLTLYAGTDTIKQRISNNHAIVALSGMLDTMDPAHAWQYLHFVAVQQTSQTLAQFDRLGQIKADLAVKWEIDDEKKTYTFYLDKQAKFHDGSPVLASDVAVSLARHFWPDSKSIIGGYLLGHIEGVSNLKNKKLPSGITVVNSHQLIIRLSKAYPQLLAMLTMPGFGVVKASSIGKVPPITSGSMVPTYDPSRKEWLLRPNPWRKNKNQKIKTLTLKNYSSQKVLLEDLRTQKVDIAMGYYVDPKDETLPKPYYLTHLNNPGVLHLYYNNNVSIFQNEILRHDISALIRNEVSELKGLAVYLEKQDHFLPKGLLPPKYYSQNRLKMSVADFQRKWQGRLPKQEFKFYVSNKSEPIRLGSSIQKTLREVGLNITLVNQDISELVQTIRSQKYAVIMIGYFGIFSDPDGFLDPIRSGPEGLRFGIIPHSNLFEKIEKIKYIQPNSSRLDAYANALIEFEQQDYFLSLFGYHLPAIQHSLIKLPDAQYRFDTNLSYIRWSD